MLAKKATSYLAELVKRVPPNQIKAFDAFLKKCNEYQRRVNSYPDKLPIIDWDYYRNNVRQSHRNLVDEFKVSYEEINHAFASRHTCLDHSKYFIEVDELKPKVAAEVKEYVDMIEERLEILRNEIKRLQCIKYDNMTLEEFIEVRKEVSQLIPCQGKPLFWPHTPEEQLGAKEEDKKDLNTSKNNC